MRVMVCCLLTLLCVACGPRPVYKAYQAKQNAIIIAQPFWYGEDNAVFGSRRGWLSVAETIENIGEHLSQETEDADGEDHIHTAARLFFESKQGVTASVGALYESDKNGKRGYSAAVLNPGHYTLSSWEYFDRSGLSDKMTHVVYEGTSPCQFDVKAGDIIYIGDIEIFANGSKTPHVINRYAQSDKAKRTLLKQHAPAYRKRLLSCR